MEETKMLKRGMDGFQIKVLALVLMLLDHIHYFFGFTGKVPLLFSQLGRLAGPLFMFIVVEGFIHTSNRKNYFKRIYLLSVLMGAVNYGIMCFGLVRGDGFFPMNNVFATFALVMVFLQGIDWIKSKDYLRGVTALALPVVLNIVFYLLPPTWMSWFYVLEFIALPLPMFVEGGVFFVITGVLLYLLRSNRKLQVGVFAAFTLLWPCIMGLIMRGSLSLPFMILENYEWMGAFAAIFMLAYNGKRGRNAKRLFYVFYPTHVYLLYILSFMVYSVL